MVQEHMMITMMKNRKSRKISIALEAKGPLLIRPLSKRFLSRLSKKTKPYVEVKRLQYLPRKFLVWLKIHQDSWVKVPLASLISKEVLYRRLRTILLLRQSRKCLLVVKKLITLWSLILWGLTRSISSISLIPSFIIIAPLQKHKMSVKRDLRDTKVMNSSNFVILSTSGLKAWSQPISKNKAH